MTTLIVLALACVTVATSVAYVRALRALGVSAKTTTLLESRLLTLRTELTKTKAGRDYLERAAPKD